MNDLAKDLDDLVGPAPRLQLVPEAAPPPHPALVQWERCRAWLEPALKGGRRTVQDVERALIEGRAQLWPGKACAVVTEVHQFAEAKALQVWLAGGDADEMRTLQGGIEAWARLMGCTESLVEGRKGIERALKDTGYELWSVCMRKAL